MIRLEHVTKKFISKGHEITAVNDVSLTIEKGEIFGIIGFSGAGKSTLVEAILSDEVRDFINENYQGAVVPVF